MSRPSSAAVLIEATTESSIKTIIIKATNAGLGAGGMTVGEYATALLGDVNIGPIIDIAYGGCITCYQQERHLKLMIRTMIADGDIQLKKSGVDIVTDETSISA